MCFLIASSYFFHMHVLLFILPSVPLLYSLLLTLLHVRLFVTSFFNKYSSSVVYIMHPALRKGPLFTKKLPPFSTFYTKNTPISFPAYGPALIDGTACFVAQTSVTFRGSFGASCAGHTNQRRHTTQIACVTQCETVGCDQS